MKNKIKYLPIGLLTLTTVLSGASLAGVGVFATTAACTTTNGTTTCSGAGAIPIETGVASNTATVHVSSACTFTNTDDATETASFDAGVYDTTHFANLNTIQAVCNDASGLKVYAIGYSENTDGNTNLVSEVGTIATGTYTEGDTTSSWAMKITDNGGTNTAVIPTAFQDYNVVPNDYTLVASFAPQTATASSIKINTSYAVFASRTQPAGSYTGKVKYTITSGSAAAPAKAS